MKPITGRQAFTPDEVVRELMNQWKEFRQDITVSDMINNRFISSFCPYNEALYSEFDTITRNMKEFPDMKQEDRDIIIRSALARAVRSLKDNPISSCENLEQIAIHYRTGMGRQFRYDYILLIDEKSDEILQNLNRILYSVDHDYNIGQRELGERTRDIFKHWNKLCGYRDIYTALATIIDNEYCYLHLDELTALDLIKRLDRDIVLNKAEIKGDTYPLKDDIEAEISSIRYQINIYQCDNGYAVLSGDNRFDKMPDEFRALEREWANSYLDSKPRDEALAFVKDVDKRGRIILTKLAMKNPEITARIMKK